MDKKALYDITYGLYVISARFGKVRNGQVANTAVQMTSEPVTIGVCINKQNYTHELIEKSGRFCISTLSQDTPMELIGLFGFKSGRETDKFAAVDSFDAAGGSPVLNEHTLGYLECIVTKSVDVGTHTLFVGELSDADVLQKGTPMTYAYYHQVKKGTAPKTAPTYRGSDEPAANTVAKPEGRYRCPICGYIYDPAVGDPEHKVKPGTRFEDLPDDWKCPVCGAPKSGFVAE